MMADSIRPRGEMIFFSKKIHTWLNTNGTWTIIFTKCALKSNMVTTAGLNLIKWPCRNINRLFFFRKLQSSLNPNWIWIFIGSYLTKLSFLYWSEIQHGNIPMEGRHSLYIEEIYRLLLHCNRKFNNNWKKLSLSQNSKLSNRYHQYLFRCFFFYFKNEFVVTEEKCFH